MTQSARRTAEARGNGAGNGAGMVGTRFARDVQGGVEHGVILERVPPDQYLVEVATDGVQRRELVKVAAIAGYRLLATAGAADAAAGAAAAGIAMGRPAAAVGGVCDHTSAAPVRPAPAWLSTLQDGGASALAQQVFRYLRFQREPRAAAYLRAACAKNASVIEIHEALEELAMLDLVELVPDGVSFRDQSFDGWRVVDAARPARGPRS